MLSEISRINGFVDKIILSLSQELMLGANQYFGFGCGRGLTDSYPIMEKFEIVKSLLLNQEFLTN